MDRAEAVKILEIQLDVTEVNTPSCIKLHEALDLAIDALKEPTGDYEFFGGTYAKEGDAESATTKDCISRQAAIEAFCDDCRGLKPGQCEHWDSCNSQRELRSLPPVTPPERTGEWIPVSERLPEYMVDMWDEGVIATVNGREGNIIYENGIVPDAWFEDGKWYVNDVELENAKVVAWQPLPEPYKGGEE